MIKLSVRPDPDCQRCTGTGVILTENRKQKPCVCYCKSYVLSQLSRFSEVKFRNPKVLEKAKPLTYIQTSITNFKHDVAGYLLSNYPLTFMYLTAQDLFTYKWESKEINEILEPDLLLLDFVGVVPNKLIPLYVNQLIEEREIYPNKSTWVMSKYSREELLRHLGFREFEESNIAVLRETLDKFYILGKVTNTGVSKKQITKNQLLGNVRIGL